MQFSELDQLGRSDLQATVDRLDLARLEAVMLWPDDVNTEYRRNFIECTEILRALELRNQLTRIQAIEMLEVSVGLPAIQEFRNNSTRQHIRGMVAGVKLGDSVSAHHFGLSVRSMGEIVKDICDLLTPRAKQDIVAQVQPGTVENDVWPKFKCVAHFWATRIRLATCEGKSVWPCKPDKLELFLAEARQWQILGESTTPPRSHQPILRIGEAAEIPGADHLPSFEITSSDLSHAFGKGRD